MIYLYACSECGATSTLYARVADRNREHYCAICGHVMSRRYTPPQLITDRMADRPDNRVELSSAERRADERAYEQAWEKSTPSTLETAGVRK